MTVPEEPAEGQENGLLQAWEVFERVRLDAEVVALSACETGKGKVYRAEGIVGLTRAFMFAGVPRVLVSLRRVEGMKTVANGHGLTLGGAQPMVMALLHDAAPEGKAGKRGRALRGASACRLGVGTHAGRANRSVDRNESPGRRPGIYTFGNHH